MHLIETKSLHPTPPFWRADEINYSHIHSIKCPHVRSNAKEKIAS